MFQSATDMDRLNAALVKPLGELTTFGLTLGTGALSWLEIITPILGFIGVLLGCIAGVYTIIIRRKQTALLNKQDHQYNELT